MDGRENYFEYFFVIKRPKPAEFILKESQTQNYQFVADNSAESSQLITA